MFEVWCNLIGSHCDCEKNNSEFDLVLIQIKTHSVKHSILNKLQFNDEKLVCNIRTKPHWGNKCTD